MRTLVLLLVVGLFSFTVVPTNEFDLVEAEELQLMQEIEAQIDLVDHVSSIELQNDNGVDYYHVIGSKDGQPVIFDAALSAKGKCSCRKNNATALSDHFFWVCINPCS